MKRAYDSRTAVNSVHPSKSEKLDRIKPYHLPDDYQPSYIEQRKRRERD
jgi:hypothetical protein